MKKTIRVHPQGSSAPTPAQSSRHAIVQLGDNINAAVALLELQQAFILANNDRMQKNDGELTLLSFMATAGLQDLLATVCHNLDDSQAAIYKLQGGAL